MLTVLTILIVAALIMTIVAGTGRIPLWPSVLLLAIIEALRVLPLK